MCLVFPFLHSKDPPWFICFLIPWVYIPPFAIFRANSLGPLDACSCLIIYLFPFLSIWEPVSGEEEWWPVWLLQAVQKCHGTLGSFACFFVQVHLWGDESPWNIRWFLSALSLGCSEGILVLPRGDLLYSRRNKLNKRVKGTCPKIKEVEKLLKG